MRAYGDTLTALDGTAADFADRYGALQRDPPPAAISRRQCSTPCTLTPTPLTDTINAPEAAVLNAATHDLDVLNALLALDGRSLQVRSSGQVL